MPCPLLNTSKIMVKEYSERYTHKLPTTKWRGNRNVQPTYRRRKVNGEVLTNNRTEAVESKIPQREIPMNNELETESLSSWRQLDPQKVEVKV